MTGFWALLIFVFFIASIILALVFGFTASKKKSNADYVPKHHWGKLTLYSLIAGVACIMFYNWSYAGSPEAKEDARKESSSKVASKKKESSKKASSVKASSIAESKKKEKKELSSAREANEKRNFVAYKKALKSVPTNTHNAITKAYVDDSNSQTILVLSDDALTLSDNELKAVVKSAWNADQKLLENNTPFPEDDSGASMYTTVQDSAGNELAHTSTFGSFKYDN